MEINFKELHRLRSERCKEKYVKKRITIHQNHFEMVEMPGYLYRSYWHERQNGLIEYLLHSPHLFKDKNVLVLYDGIGFCGLVAYLVKAKVTICEEKEYWDLIQMNMKECKPKLITPLEYEKDDTTYDYVIVSEMILSKHMFEKIRFAEKIIVGIKKDYWETEKFITKDVSKKERSIFPEGYQRKQVTPLKSHQNVIFELEKIKTSWLEKT